MATTLRLNATIASHQKTEIPKKRSRFQHLTWPYVIFSPLVQLFAWYVRGKKRMAGGQPIEHYAWFYDQHSEPVKAVRIGAARWPALKALYGWRPYKHGLMGILESFWMNVRSAQALRNRYTIVVEQIHKATIEAIRRDGEARILSLACGSAQSVFEAVKDLPHVRILAVDIDDTAIEYSKTLAEAYGITHIEWHKGNVLQPGLSVGDFRPNVVEIVGLFDYLTDRLIAGLIHRITALSSPQFTMIAAHIHPNPEMNILRDIADWDMTYREQNDYRVLIQNGGFAQNVFITEPHGIFTVSRSESA